VPLAPAKLVNVNVTDDERLLTVRVPLGGSVDSSPAGIANCRSNSGTCSQLFGVGASVTLTPTPDFGFVFSGWMGDADCLDGVVVMTESHTCTANFTFIIVGP
jgi:hypothetical protein